MAKKSNNRKSPRTLKYAGAAPKSKYSADCCRSTKTKSGKCCPASRKAQKPCGGSCVAPVAAPAPSTGWRKWVAYVIRPIDRFLNGVN